MHLNNPNKFPNTPHVTIMHYPIKHHFTHSKTHFDYRLMIKSHVTIHEHSITCRCSNNYFNMLLITCDYLISSMTYTYETTDLIKYVKHTF